MNTHIHQQAVQATAEVLAAPGLNTNGISQWFEDNVLIIGLLIVGAIILFGAKSQAWGKVLSVAAIAMVGVFIIANPQQVKEMAVAIGNVVAGG